MKLTFLGAARTVTGSCHLLEVGDKQILLECGLRQGRRKESYRANRQFAFNPRKLDAVVLSHAHIDHSGNLPRLAASGYNGPIFATSATADLCGWMLRDSAYIQEKDVQYVNKRRRKRGQKPFEPLYVREDAEKAIEQFHSCPYSQSVEVTRGVRVTFEDAGHILGSASCHFDILDRGKERRLVFTGDVGRQHRPVIRDPVPPKRADILISECTYGDRLHDSEECVRSKLLEVISDTLRRGGRVLIPAFSVGRTQHLVYHLHCLLEAGELPQVPIFVDSPLAANVTDVYRDHPECYDEETASFIARDDDPFGFHRLQYLREVAASKALNDSKDPAVIISASGMCEAGRVLHHLKRIAPDPKSTILIVGYMAPNTLGRRLVERQPRVRIYGEEYDLRARVEFIGGLSGHADRDELLTYLETIDPRPARTFLVHGDEEPALAFAETLTKAGFPAVEAPSPGDSFEL